MRKIDETKIILTFEERNAQVLAVFSTRMAVTPTFPEPQIDTQHNATS
jgi:hypothetical protein